MSWTRIRQPPGQLFRAHCVRAVQQFEHYFALRAGPVHIVLDAKRWYAIWSRLIAHDTIRLP